MKNPSNFNTRNSFRQFSKQSAEKIWKVTQTVWEWETPDIVIHDTLKTKGVFFSEAHWQKLNWQLQETKNDINSQKIVFNKETTR